MTIKAELRIEIQEIEEDFPGHQREYYRQEVRQGLINFINRFVDDHTHSTAEDRAIRFDIAMQLLESFQRGTGSDLIGEDLLNRKERNR